MFFDLAISVKNVSKAYTIWRDPTARLKHPFLELAGELFPPLRKRIDHHIQELCQEFYALQDISLEIRKGESFGIIGRNGSGKSTLLQIIAGTLQPSSGSVTVNGRVAALLELGSGFNPEFTGRENVYLNASILGLTREETDARFSAIAAFADIGHFMDQPVKTYSSGMMVRLGFAVQSQVDPDLLIVDEALAVGDAKFQAQCFERLRQLKKNGTSILLVTHSSEQIVTHCSRAMLLEQGHLLELGEPKKIANAYMELLFGKERKKYSLPSSQPPHELEILEEASSSFVELSCLNYDNDLFATRHGYNRYEYRWGDQAATILDFFLTANNEAYPSSVKTGDKVRLALSIKFRLPIYHPILGFTLKTKEGITIYGTNSHILPCPEMSVLGKESSVVSVSLEFLCRLASGDYFLSLGVASEVGGVIIPHDRRYDAIHLQIAPNQQFFGLADLEISMQVNKIML